MSARAKVLRLFHPAVAEWFRASFAAPTPPQSQGWPAIARGDSTLILAPTGSGKTLTAFLWCIHRLMFDPVPAPQRRCRVLYVSPLKALAVDIERNLRAPLAGIAHRAAALGVAYHAPAIAVRTGDTPAAERARFLREPADILITTPESLYLLLTSNAREALRSIDTVIIDEIHALVPTKRGAHLALSLERLEELTRISADTLTAAAADQPNPNWRLQRIGLSATQRPLDEVARFLGGSAQQKGQGKRDKGQRERDKGQGTREEGRGKRRDEQPQQAIHDEFTTERPAATEYREVTIVDTLEKKRLELRIEVPVEDMAKVGQRGEIPSGPASQSPVRTSIWTAIHPRLLELVRAHQSTLIFVNSRRVAERLASALNELAGEVLVRSHHGSLARPQRIEVEDRLKAGQIRGLVATSSLELGIDMGAIDLVVQIEAPPSVASGMQRIGRAGHTIGAASRGIIVPKFRGDLVACAAVTRAMHEARIESSRYPRNPLDVLSQQIVAMVAMDEWNVDSLFRVVRGAAPYVDLSPGVFEGVLDMLSGRYPSDDFADLRPRLTWDRLEGTLTARESAKRVAVINGGTIPDRGLYGVFLSGERGPGARVGELDEEMVFECRVGETFLLGASSWRIEDITHDRVIVSPAPGEPGKMPFWKADAAGRPLELGRNIGEMVRSLRHMPPASAIQRLVTHHDLDPQAAENLLRYLSDQSAAAGVVPDDRTILIERCRDELGDWRICVLSPFGGRIHAPWAMAVVERARAETGVDVETMWTDDGFVVRFPETDEPPDPRLMVPASEEVEALVLRQLSGTALFAAKFREAAGRALLLPKRRPGGRSPLWQQRKRAANLLAVAARYGSFPMLLEAYRECLRDVFDMPALVDTLRRIERREVKAVTVDSTIPSPFASALLFGYVANYIYDGDAPLAERRAQALAIDQSQLKELLGEAELRELLDADALAEVEAQLQHLADGYPVKSTDGVHDLLLRLGDLTIDELLVRSRVDAAEAVASLVRARRAITIPIAGQTRVIPVEYAGRYRDALGVPLPPGLPESLLESSPNAGLDLARRYARTHGPFTSAEFGVRYGLGRATAEGILKEGAVAGRLLEGEFRPGGSGREWCDPDVLQTVRRRSLAKLRRQVEPVDPAVLGRLVTTWQGVVRKRAGLDALLDAIETLQGAPLPASIFESEILAARVEGYNHADLDALTAAGEVIWCGLEPLGERDGRLAVYLPDHFGRLRRPASDVDLPPREQAILDHLRAHGASFFATMHEAAGGGYPGDTVDALWNLVWHGFVTNDTFHALRAFTRPPERRRRRPPGSRTFRSRRVAPPSAEGRWSLLDERATASVSMTARSAALAEQLLSRYGVLTREVAAAEGIGGGFSAVYSVLKALEDAGRIRRGYFVAAVGATQFALPPALDLLRSLKDAPDEPEVVSISATDPASPYGTILKWPATPDRPADAGRGPTRTVGSLVLLVNGALGAYISRGARNLLAFLPEDEPSRSMVGRAVARRLAALARDEDGRGGLLIGEINSVPAAEHPLAAFLAEAGFYPSAMGFHMRRHPSPSIGSAKHAEPAVLARGGGGA
ncbi:MAG: DEAD/DEAH box helicase [Acidobacteria bacterium]|nr:DEAD/DEAH box helicase [Acidobacteriota bacterium]MCA1650827.1 DEAD/DEAH box helicase [Acidobacteriota bacterium]